MKAIYNPKIKRHEGKFLADCQCGRSIVFSNKDNALKMLSRGSCRSCKKDYRSVRDSEFDIYRRPDGRWCCKCSGCGVEQAYTRKCHAKQSSVSDWQCKKCCAERKAFSKNRPVGDRARVFNKFRKSAYSRGIAWNLSEDEMFADFNEQCQMTGWPISISYENSSASLDRIDSKVGYEVGNIQWVHTMVNMAKNKYDASEFIRMCKAVADKVKW